MADLGCAQDKDSNLLLPSQIKCHPAPSSSPRPTTLDCFFISGDSGSCQSGHATHPSKRVIDPDNTEAPTLGVSSSSKRKIGAAHNVTWKHGHTHVTQVTQHVILDSDESDNDATSTEPEVKTDDAGNVDDDPFEATEKADSGEEDAEASYASIKALRDTDHKRTADVRTVFTADSNHLNLDTGKPEKGHLCTLCKRAGIAGKHTFFTSGVSTLRLQVRTQTMDLNLLGFFAVNWFTRDADDSPEKMELMHEVLWETAKAHQSFSSSQDPTVWQAIPVLEFLQEAWSTMSAHPRFLDISDAINHGLKNLNKWYQKLDETNVYFICLVLDLKWKLTYVCEKWDKEYFDEGVRQLEEVESQEVVVSQEAVIMASHLCLKQLWPGKLGTSDKS
ncbi:hypothetical protein BJV77DRAFT_1070053 [Russula vinacea]|nr:hypothetical protein BJV77DRAFT_1070053 [Russula vinacea]